MHLTIRSVVPYTALFLLFGTFFICIPLADAAYPIEQIPGGDQVFGDFVVGPTKVDLTIEAGKDRVVELMVTNRMGDRRLFSLEVEDTKGSDDPDQTVVLLGDDRGPYSLKDYFKFPEKTFELGQGERARIPVTISVPADAQPGGLYGSVLVTTTSVPESGEKPVQSGAKSGSVIISRIGALFFVTVPGDIEKSGELQSFKTIPDTPFYANGPIHFQVLYKNTGSVHLNPYGVLSIKNMLGEEVGVVVADPWFSLPQSVRLRELSWDRPYLFGRYTADIKINRGYDNIIDTKSVTFYVVPWKLLALAVLALALVFFCIRFIVRTFEIKRK